MVSPFLFVADIEMATPLTLKAVARGGNPRNHIALFRTDQSGSGFTRHWSSSMVCHHLPRKK
jgi:hypothetical protein